MTIEIPIRARKLEREKKESRMFDKLQRLVSEGVELSGAPPPLERPPHPTPALAAPFSIG